MDNDVNGDDLFSKEMEDVKPIQQDQAHIEKVNQDTPGKKIRRRLAVATDLRSDPLTSVEVPKLGSNDILCFKQDGIQHGVFKKLRMGKYSIDARLDLHRKSVEESRVEVFGFLRDCYQYELRTAIILHGKGDRSPDKIALLKSHLAIWLPQIDEVVAFHSAQKQHGGTGAVYVLLKKGSGAKQKNRELHGLK